MGAKNRLLPFIVPQLEMMLGEDGILLDLMAGTHSIGYAMKNKYRIYANDIQYYSWVFGQAIIVNDKDFSISTKVDSDFSNLDQNYDKWFVNTYADTYFSKSQCIEITQIRERINQFKNEYLRALYLTILANSMSLCQSSSGHFAQYFPKSHPRLKNLRSMSIIEEFKKRARRVEILPNFGVNHVYKEDIFSLLKDDKIINKIGKNVVVYLDPPYTSAQYSRYYHLLETVFLMDKPNVAHKGLYRSNRFQSPFCSQRQVLETFTKVLQIISYQKWKICISYSNFGLIEPTELTALCQRYFKQVKFLKTEYAHSMQGRGQKNDREEILILCD